MNATLYGDKYAATKDLDTTGIAKLFREEVKTAIKAGTLPNGLKVSVRTSYYAGGSSVDVVIKTAPGIAVKTPEYVAYCAGNQHEVFHGDRLTNQASDLLRKLETLLDAYNYDGSDSQTDYFHVRFYGHVGFDRSL